MNDKSNFSPHKYLKNVANPKQNKLKRTVTGVLTMLFIGIGIVSTAGYVDYFSVGLAEAGQRLERNNSFQPEYQVVERPDERENTIEEIVSPAVKEDEEVFEEDEEYIEEDFDYIGENGCNVLGLTISGEIGTDYGDTTSNSFRDTLEEHAYDERVKAILVDVDSGGGSPVAGDEIATLLKEQSVPVIAQVREVAASAAYMAILPADKIFAHRWGSIGSIGVIIPYYDFTELNDDAGIKYAPILTSPSKDIGSPDRALTKEERAMLQKEIDFIYNDFVRDVAEYRNLSIEKAFALADGNTLLAHKAREAGLVDEIGGRVEVTDYLRTIIDAEPIVCWDSNLEY